MTIQRLARAGVCDIPLYDPDSDNCSLDLSDNTNLWGAPPAALRAIAEHASTVSRYPSTYSRDLRPALLDYVGLRGAVGISTVLGCGSDEIIDCAMRAFGAAGDRVAYCAPTFTMVPVFTRLNGLVPDPIPFLSNWDIDAERLVDRRAKITYICSPNNPTGTPASRTSVEYVVERANGLVLIDSAYLEFASDAFDDLVRSSERVIVTHTFSKAFGLAGLRVGYGVGAQEAIGLVARARGPYKVNVLAERAAAAALDDVEWVRRHVATSITNAGLLASALRDLGFAALPSQANFLLVPTCDASRLFDELRRRGILVRLMKGLPQDLEELRSSSGSALRIGVGPWDQMEALLGALREIL
jgi:histidinol-phosphate aminotransferase